MLFNSAEFLFVFLPLCLAGYWRLREPAHRLAWLALASLVFYAYWEPRYLPLIAAVVWLDYYAAGVIARSVDSRTRRRVLWLAVGGNLALLAGVKLVVALAQVGGATGRIAGFGGDVPGLGIVLPLGVGFFTLNGISYLVDVHRGDTPPARSLREFASFLIVFPHLIAGPIVRFTDIGPQLRALPRRLPGDYAARGLMLIGLGLAKKLLIADGLAPTINDYYGSVDTLTVTSAWAAALGYSLQLYFDFSAYSEMAVGLALLLGIRFPRNFDSPFKSRNISEFWRRWHITFGAWVRDYLYIPLGGSAGSRWVTSRNLLVVMFFGGLWHGVGVTFLIWGCYHGLLLAGHAFARARGWLPSAAWLGRAATFALVVAGFVVFRAESVGDAGTVFAAMAGANGFTGGADVTVGFAAGLAALLAYVHFAPDAWDVSMTARLRPALAIAVGVVAGLAVLKLTDPSPFLYFQF